MAELFSTQLETSPEQSKASSVEQRAISLLGYIPGLRGLVPSKRVIQAMRGGTWTFAGYGASQLLKFAALLTLARMLVPQAFGLVALVNVFLGGLEMLSDLGVGMDVVQHPRGDDPTFINTAFIIQAGRGIILCAIAAGLAYPFATFYHQPAVLTLLLVGSLSTLMRGFTSGSIWTLTRRVEIGKLTAVNTGTDFLGFLVSLAWAIISPTAWALVIGRVVSTAAFVVTSHLIAEHPVSLSWDRQAARDVLAFGAGIFLSTGTYFLAGDLERLVVGKFVTLAELGCFALALSVSAAASTGLRQVILQVFFPMMSDSLREDRDAAVRHFRRVRQMLFVVSAVLALGFIAASHTFVTIFLGPKYAMAGWMLQLLGVRGAFELFMSITASMLFALGSSKYAAIGNTFKLVFLAIGLTIAFGRFGFHEALWVLTVAPIANYIPLLFGLNRYCKNVIRSELVSLGGFVGCVLAGALVFQLVSSLIKF